MRPLKRVQKLRRAVNSDSEYASSSPDPLDVLNDSDEENRSRNGDVRITKNGSTSRQENADVEGSEEVEEAVEAHAEVKSRPGVVSHAAIRDNDDDDSEVEWGFLKSGSVSEYHKKRRIVLSEETSSAPVPASLPQPSAPPTDNPAQPDRSPHVLARTSVVEELGEEEAQQAAIVGHGLERVEVVQGQIEEDMVGEGPGTDIPSTQDAEDDIHTVSHGPPPEVIQTEVIEYTNGEPAAEEAILGPTSVPPFDMVRIVDYSLAAEDETNQVPTESHAVDLEAFDRIAVHAESSSELSSMLQPSSELTEDDENAEKSLMGAQGDISSVLPTEVEEQEPEQAVENTTARLSEAEDPGLETAAGQVDVEMQESAIPKDKVQVEGEMITGAQTPQAVDEGEEELDEEAGPMEVDGEASDVEMEEPDLAATASPSGADGKSPSTKKTKITVSNAPGKKGAGKAKGESKASAKKQAIKAKGSKVNELKGAQRKTTAGSNSTPASTDSPPTNSRQPSPTASEADDQVYCICRKPYVDEPGGNTMIGCESCDDWFHPSCIGLTDKMIAQLDAYICRSCERNTKQKTMWKKVCRRGGCGNTLTSSTSKYCSDLCAYKHLKTVADGITNKKTLKQLASAFLAYPTPTTVQTITNPKPASSDDPGVADPGVAAAQRSTVSEEQLVETIQAHIVAVEAALRLVRKRQQILEQAIVHSDQMAPVAIAPDEAAAHHKKKKGKSGAGTGAGSEERACGWDRRLIWDDVKLRAWSEEQLADAEVVDADICHLGKRTCARHQGWQKTVGIGLEVEAGQLETQLDTLGGQKDQLDRTIQVTEDGILAQKAFQERLAKKKKSHS